MKPTQMSHQQNRLHTSMSMGERLAYFRGRCGRPSAYDNLVPWPGVANFPVGVLLSQQVASEEGLRRFADAIGDLNPRYRERGYRGARSDGRLVAHPLFFQAVCIEVAGFESCPGARSFHAATEWEFARPIVEGEKLRFDGLGTESAEIRQGRFGGEMIRVSSLCRYTDADGQPVGFGRPTIFHSQSDESTRERGTYDTVAEPYRYDEDELRKIQDDRELEEMRGNTPRFWEDVNEGDWTPPIVLGPHTIMESIAHMAAVPSILNIKGDRLYRLSASSSGEWNGFVCYDERINANVNIELPHLDFDLGRAVGAPGAFDNGAEREAKVAVLFTNWMGDDGFLWKYRIEFRRFIVHGDTNWFRAQVIRKFVEDERHCVTLEFSGINQRGETTTTGTATVVLPSRTGGPARFPLPLSLSGTHPLNSCDQSRG